MKHALLFGSVLLLATTQAQPVLTAADVTPQFGPTPMIAQTDYVEPGPTGANFTLDVSQAVIGPAAQSETVLPSSTPYGSFFPQATHSATSLTNQTQYTYLRYESSAQTHLGHYSPNGNMVLSDGEKLIQMPLTYNMTWTDAFAGTGTTGPQDIIRAGSITCTYNGHGTIVMPYGTFTGVIRFEYTEDYSDNIAGLMNVRCVTRSVAYIKPGMPAALLTSTTIAIGAGGQEPQPTSAYSLMLDPSEVGIAELQGEGPSALLMPNPASEEFSVVLDPAASTGAVAISLLDAMGREVRTLQPLSAPAGARTFNVADLPRGLYLVRVADAQGRASTSRLVLR